MSDLVVVSIVSSPLVEDAKHGLLGELSAKSRRAYEPIIDSFLAYLENYLEDHPTASPAVVVSEYLRLRKDMGLAPRTLNRIRTVLRRFMEWAMRVGLIPPDEYASVKEVKAVKVQGRRAGRWLDVSGLQCILNAPDTTTWIGRRDRAILAILAGTALRRFEICSLTWDQFEHRGEGWIVTNLDRKHNRTQELLAVPDWAMKVLFDYAQPSAPGTKVFVSITKGGVKGRSITPQKVYTIVKEYGAQCGFDIAPHDLRRSWAQLALRNGVELKQISLQLGHQSVGTTEIYLKQDLEVGVVNKAFVLDV